jgi:hypothetical protein
MVTFHTDYFDKCKRVNPISFTVEPEEACWTVVLNRWRKVWSPVRGSWTAKHLAA